MHAGPFLAPVLGLAHQSAPLLSSSRQAASSRSTGSEALDESQRVPATAVGDAAGAKPQYLRRRRTAIAQSVQSGNSSVYE